MGSSSSTAVITSRQNPLIKQIISLKSRKEREESDLFVLEGETALLELPVGWPVEKIICADGFSLGNIQKKYPETSVTVISDELFKTISETVTPQGVLAICKQKHYRLDDITAKQGDLVVYLHEVNDPGNLGAILRSAAAAGCAAILISAGSTDLYNPKTVRAAAGSLFRQKIASNVAFESIKRFNLPIYASHPRGESSLYNVDFKRGGILVFGNEARGLTDEIAGACDLRVTIPMKNETESLNLSVAAGIMLFEYARQLLLS